jgi:hypothetical protein
LTAISKAPLPASKIAVDAPASGPATGPVLVAIAVMIVALIPAAAVLEVPTPLVLVLVGVLMAIALAAYPDGATLVVVAVLYSNAAVIAVRFHDVPFVLAAGFVFLLVAPLGYHLLIRRDRLVLPRATPWIFGYLLVQLVSTLLARDSTSAASALGIFVTEGLILYFLFANAVRTERMLVAIVFVLIAVAGVLSALTIHQEVTQNLSNDYFGFAQLGGDSTGLLPGEEFRQRPSGPTDGPNRYAQNLVLVLPLVFAVVWCRFSRLVSALAIGAGVLSGIAIALTLSRGAAVGFLLVLILMFALRYIPLRAIAFVAIAALVVLIAVPQYGARLQSLDSVPGLAGEGQETDGSVRSRITEMIAAALVFVDHPVVGVGPDQFQTYYIDYAEQFGLRVKQDEREAHSLYVGILSDSGALGAFFFFGAIAVTIRDLAKTRARLLHARPRLAFLATGFMLSLVAYLTTGIFLHLAMERYLWMMMALAAAVTIIGQRWIDEQGPSTMDDADAVSAGERDALETRPQPAHA